MNSTLGLFDKLCDEQLVPAWSKRKSVLDAQKYQPYADLLLTEIVWKDVFAKSDEIAAALKEKCETANAAHELFVPIWSFNHTPFYSKKAWLTPLYNGPAMEHLVHKGDEEALFLQKVHVNRWHHWMEVNMPDGEDWVDQPVLYREPIERIIRKSDFLEQLAMRFGNNFRCTLMNRTYTEGERFCRTEKEIQLHFYPRGLPEHHAKKRTKSLRAHARRTLRALASTELLNSNRLDMWVGE